MNTEEIFAVISNINGAVSYDHICKLEEDVLDDFFGTKQVILRPKICMVEELQAKLHFHFPPDYKQFLLRFGFLVWDANEVFGIPPQEGVDVESNNFSILDINTHYKAMNMDAIADFLGESLIISLDYMGGYFFIASKNGSVNYAVLEEEWQIEQSWNTFTDYLADCYRISYPG